MRALTIVYILLACTVAGFSQTTATYDNVRARQQLTLNGHTLTSVLQTIDSLSTHAQGVTAKAVYDYIATKYSTVSAGTGIDVVKAGSNYTISLDTLKRLHFRTDSTYSGGVGTMRWNLTDGTLDLGLLGGNVTLQLGQESVQRVKHADNSGLTEGKAVYIVGSSGDNLTVRYAQANTESTSANTFGVMTESASGGDKAFCTTFGLVRNINTSNLTEGGMVWLSKDTAGALTAVRPTAPNHGVEIGFCVRKHATAGVIFVTIQNGYELRELHDVYAPSPSNNQGLLWKSANLRWEAAAVDTSLTNEGRLIGFKPSNNSYYNIGSSTNGSSPIILYRGSGIGFSGTSGSPEGGDLTISNTGDLDSGNEGILGVGEGTATSSVITSNTSGASGVTINASGGISISETTSSNGGSINLSATDQSISNEGILGVAINPGANAWLRSNTSTANDIGLVGTNNTTITATANSNGGQIVIDSKAQIDTFSLSGQTLSASLLNDGVAASSVTLPIVDVVAGTNVTVTKSNGVATVSATGGGGGGTPAGSTGEIQYNNSGAFGASSNLAWDNTNRRLNLGSASSISNLSIKSTSDGATIGTTEQSSAYTASAGWSGSGLTWTHASGGGTTTLTATLANNANGGYRVVLSVSGRTSGSFTLTFKGNSVSGVTSTGTYNLPYINANNIVVTPTNDFNGTITFSFVLITNGQPTISIENNSSVVTTEIRSAGQSNLLLGYRAGAQSIGTECVAAGSEAATRSLSSRWTAVGFQSGQSCTTGQYWTAVGYRAGALNTTGNNWTAFGYQAAGTSASGGFFNAIGYQAAVSNTSGNFFNAMGYQAANSNQSGNNFTSVGHQSASSNTTGSFWTAIGSRAGGSNTTGGYWVAIGSDAAYFSTDGTTPSQFFQDGVYIGTNCRATNGTSGSLTTNETVIGHLAVGQGSNTTVIGNNSTTKTWIGGNLLLGSTGAASARAHVVGSNTNSTDYSLIITNSGGSTTTPAICAQNNQKVGIGTNSVDSGATLEVDGTTGGILFPRLTTTERDALTPVNGLMIYNTTTSKFQGYAGGAWVDLH